MKGSELFGVFVRAASFVIIIYGAWEILGGLENVAENLLSASEEGSADQLSSLSYFVFGIPALLVGVLSFFLADFIVRLTYRNPSA